MVSTFSGPRPLRWLVVGSFGGKEDGRVYSLAGERLSDVMREVAPRIEVPLGGDLGTEVPPRIALSFSRMRDFRASAVIHNVPLLSALVAWADGLRHSRGPVDLGPPLDRLRTLVGTGALLEAAQALRSAQTSPDASSSAVVDGLEQASDGRGDPLDAIFSRAKAPTSDGGGDARSGIDRFVAAIRREPAPARPHAGVVAALAELAEEAALATAHDLVAADEVRRLEAAWRGVAMIVSRIRDVSDSTVDLLDVQADGALDKLRRRLAAPVDLRPDAVFLLDAPEAGHAELAELAETAMVPIAVPIPVSVATASDADVPSWWAELRDARASLWLCAVANGPVVADSREGARRRRVVAPPSVAVASMLSEALSRDGTLARVVGRDGALVVPTASDTDATAEVIERPVSIDDQRVAAERGIVLFGRDPDRNRVLCVSMTTVFGGEDAQSLPSQILVGRAVRMVRDALEGLGRDPDPGTLDAALGRLAAVLLPRGPVNGARFGGSRTPDGQLRIDVRFGQTLTGTPLAFGFTL